MESFQTIRLLAEQAAAYTAEIRSDRCPAFTVAEIYSQLDADGHLNTHLENPLNHGPEFVGAIRPRDVPLTGDEPVYGSYLSLKFSFHSERIHLVDHDDVTALEQYLLSDTALFNSFVYHVVAFQGSKLKRYVLRYRGRCGNIIALDKQNQNTLLSSNWYSERQIVWID